MIAKYKKTKWHRSLLGAMLITLVAAFGLTKAQTPQIEATNNIQQPGDSETPVQNKEFNPFPPDCKGMLFRFSAYYNPPEADVPISGHVSYRPARRFDPNDVTIKIAEPDDVFVFDRTQSLWRNERTNETYLELFVMGKDAIYWLSGDYHTEKERLEALARRNKVDQRYHGHVTTVRLTAGINESVNDDYTFDAETRQWRERTTGNLIPLEEFRKLKNLEVRIDDDRMVLAAKALITWKNRGETILGLDLSQTKEPYHREPLDAPSPFPANSSMEIFVLIFMPTMEKSVNTNDLCYVRLGPEDVFVFENGTWRNETTGATSPQFFVEGDDGLYLLTSQEPSQTGYMGKIVLNAESEQGIYSYRNGRWLNLETGEYTSREALEQDENLNLKPTGTAVIWNSLASGTHIRVSQLARKISVLDPRPEFDEKAAPMPARMLEDNEVLIFADGKWRNVRTDVLQGQVNLSRMRALLVLNRTGDGFGIVERLGCQEYGVSGTGKYIRLSDGGMTIETSDTPFEE